VRHREGGGPGAARSTFGHAATGRSNLRLQFVHPYVESDDERAIVLACVWSSSETGESPGQDVGMRCPDLGNVPITLARRDDLTVPNPANVAHQLNAAKERTTVEQRIDNEL
jgi:hypothetical protein